MIRHGETEANAGRIMAGSLDSPLTAQGRDQAALARKIVEALQEKPKVIVHSHLSRARDTAAIINQGLQLPTIEDPDIAEMHTGDWEGRPYDECQAVLHSWVQPPGGECPKDFVSRVLGGKKKALELDIQPALIVSHGGVFRAFGKIYEIEPEAKFRNCHLYEFLPNTAQSHFPWDVYHYEWHDSGALQRAPCPLFSTAVSLAS